MSDWQDMIVGDRMVVDDEFSARVDQSGFTRQEWGLIMTATSFEVREPADEEAARLVADTSDLPGIMPELENVANMGPMGQPQRDSSGNGFFDSLLGSLGLGDGDDEQERLEEAERLVAAYAEQLQAHLEDQCRWNEVRAAAAAQAEE
jgi:hypothetical protein